MADTKDQTDNPYSDGEEEGGTDEFAEIVNNIMDKVEADEEDDDGGFDQSFEIEAEPEDNTVSPDEGRKLLDDAQLEKDRVEKKTPEEPKAEKKGDEPASKQENKANDGEDQEAANDEDGKSADLTSASIDDLLDGVAEDRKAELTARLKTADEAMAPFQTAYAKGQLAQFGATPAEMASRLTHLAEFASQKPAEYGAWLFGEMAESPEKVIDVMNEAAKFHGLRVVRDDPDFDDDDPFEDEEKAQMRRRIAELERGQQPMQFGPDTPDRVQTRNVAQELDAWRNETNAEGQPLRPMFDKLQPVIQTKAIEHRNATGQAVTVADLTRFYDEAVSDLRTAFGVSNPDPAAQQDADMAQTGSTTAASTAKARVASKSIDGTGQGASRRPALPQDAPLSDVIAHFVDSSEG